MPRWDLACRRKTGWPISLATKRQFLAIQPAFGKLQTRTTSQGFLLGTVPKKSPNTFFSKEGRGGFCRNLKMTRSMPSCEPHPPDSTNSSGARTVPASFADGDAFAQRHRPRHWILPSMGLLAQRFPAGAPAPQ